MLEEGLSNLGFSGPTFSYSNTNQGGDEFGNDLIDVLATEQTFSHYHLSRYNISIDFLLPIYLYFDYT